MQLEYLRAKLPDTLSAQQQIQEFPLIGCNLYLLRSSDRETLDISFCNSAKTVYTVHINEY